MRLDSETEMKEEEDEENTGDDKCDFAKGGG